MNIHKDINNLKTYTYTEYRSLIDDLHSDKKTTGDNHSEEMLNYSLMNVTRMKRLDKTAKLKPELIELLENAPFQKWLIISEAWCGDAAQNIPWIVKMASHNPGIQVSIVLRDQNLALMDQFLTNGGRSIPKVISLDSDSNVLFSWGPRPQLLQNVYTEMKEDGKPYSEISTTIHTLYAKDKGMALQAEFEALLG